MERRGPHGRGRMAEKPKNLKKTLGLLLRYTLREMPAFIAALVFAGAHAILTIIGPRQISRITDLITAGLTTGIDMRAVARVGLLLVAIYSAGALATFLQSWLLTGFNQRLSKRMRREIVEKINRLPLSYFNFHETGDVLSRVTNDVDTVGSSLSNSLASIVTAALQLR